MNLRGTHRIVLLALVMGLAALLAPAALASIKDGRSPDTRDAAYLAQLDLRSPDTIDAAVQAHAAQPAVDLRSPDTQDAAVVAHGNPPPSVVLVGNGGFDWTDAGIGAAGGFAIAFLLGGAFVLTQRGSRGKLAL